MTQFAPRRQQPMRADSYRRLARLARVYADRIETAADAAEARTRKARTDAVNGLMRLARAAWRRHHGRASEQLAPTEREE